MIFVKTWFSENLISDFGLTFIMNDKNSIFRNMLYLNNAPYFNKAFNKIFFSVYFAFLFRNSVHNDRLIINSLLGYGLHATKIKK